MKIFNLIKNNFLLFSFIVLAIILTVSLLFMEQQKEEFVLTGTSPLPGKIISASSRQPLTFYFSSLINEKTINIKIIPETKFTYKVKTEGGKNTVELTPNPWWEYDQDYQIIISKNLLSQKGTGLNRDEIFNFTLSFPPAESLPAIP